ncbi:MAG: YqiA/YcfP family alpha/beta fold hydrolase [Chloroflexota bacterium]|nr:YqiA/YcfP family alpha/beta fold hydrolase [Chloroflexota bacterium]
MAKKTILLLHGFISSAQSTKAQYLGEQFESLPQAAFHAIDFNPTPRDFAYMTITGRINRLRQYVLDHQIAEMNLIGSSLGGLVALHYAHRFGGIERMLLLAPALSWLSGGLAEEELAQWEEAGAMPIFHPAFEREIPIRYDLQIDGRRYLDPVPPPTPVAIIHGRDDETVPIEHSRTYALTYPDDVNLVEVNAGHDLNGRLDLIWEYVQSFLLKAKGGKL